jgi:hypothetical protein
MVLSRRSMEVICGFQPITSPVHRPVAASRAACEAHGVIEVIKAASRADDRSRGERRIHGSSSRTPAQTGRLAEVAGGCTSKVRDGGTPGFTQDHPLTEAPWAPPTTWPHPVPAVIRDSGMSRRPKLVSFCQSSRAHSDEASQSISWSPVSKMANDYPGTNAVAIPGEPLHAGQAPGLHPPTDRWRFHRDRPIIPPWVLTR